MSVYSSNYLIGQYENELAASNDPRATEHKTSLDQDAFLTILVTQLTNQDPMNPMEDTEMTAQLAEFSSLEQLTNINTNIKALGDENEYQQLLAATSFIGKTVKAQGYNLSKDEDSISTLHYGLGESVQNLTVNVYNQSGDLVRSVELGSKQSGAYEYQWDGKDAEGNEVPDGTYSVAMVAEDVNGEPVYIQTEVSGEVTGIVSENGQYYLRLGDGRYVNFANVTEVQKDDGTGSTGGGDDPDDGDGSEEAPDEANTQPGEVLEGTGSNVLNSTRNANFLL